MHAHSPKHPGRYATPQQMCDFWRAMDSYYGTQPNTPLHHDGRCEVHAPLNRQAH